MPSEVLAGPLVCLSVFMIVGAVIDGWMLKVPNWLTFPMILTSWAYWLIGHGAWPAAGYSVMGAFLAGALLVPLWLVGGMGAGDVKLYAGFGGWMVPFAWFGFTHLLWAFAFSVILGGVMGVAMALWQKTWFANVQTGKEILGEWQSLAAGTASREQVADKAKARKPKAQLIPYGIPLTIGSLAYVYYLAMQ